MPLLNLLRRPARPAVRCGWTGESFLQCPGVPRRGILLGWPCGHPHPGEPTPTCDDHAGTLLARGGEALVASPCPVCGEVGSGRVVGAADLA